MKKIETHIYIALAVFVALFIVGSFYDYELSNMLYSKQNMFGLVTSVIEPTFGYGVVAFLGGGFLSSFLSLYPISSEGRYAISCFSSSGISIGFDR